MALLIAGSTATAYYIWHIVSTFQIERGDQRLRVCVEHLERAAKFDQRSPRLLAAPILARRAIEIGAGITIGWRTRREPATSGRQDDQIQIAICHQSTS